MPGRPAPTPHDTLPAKRTRNLLAVLVLAIVAHPLVLETGYFGRIVVACAFLGAVAFGVVALADVPRHRTLVRVLAAVSGAATILAVTVPFDSLWPFAVFDLLHVAFYAHIAFVLFRFVWFGGSDTGAKLIAAICVYLLLGLLWSDLYSALHYLAVEAGSSAFLGASIDDADVHDAGFLLTYFSFVTLTTLGYGDITPTTPITRMLVTLEAITGILYVATMIASLVGRYEAGHGREDRG